MDKKELFKDALINAGWYEGRNIKNEIENNPLYKILPPKIQDFYCEFGGLTLHAENSLETMIINIDHFRNEKVVECNNFETYRINDEIDFENDDLEYYYSTLIGTQLYYVAGLIENNSVHMDENGNFYIIDFIPQFTWVSDNAFEALTKIVVGSAYMYIFNEHTMKWMPPAGKELPHPLPINPLFKDNPWG
ncbi:SUKH-3 domain-containing protein [Flavobacterium tyrosinilyticum]|uniref:SUKH-3 domain-containing protein n=1 Tax=Flavobacterium tyrosinilyticum TaxID=1658740 RepID=UPI00202E30CC|nr:SUKH-3 domain-containing protein [Flavobacterium tyrosinilyticum]MCM0666538.1 SUKH-3 domain-containing protein [Flavobacterium tyrosinilyticum]